LITISLLTRKNNCYKVIHANTQCPIYIISRFIFYDFDVIYYEIQKLGKYNFLHILKNKFDMKLVSKYYLKSLNLYSFAPHQKSIGILETIQVFSNV